MLNSFPVFPTLHEEGKTGGYDVAIDYNGFPLFLQFKLSEKMTRSHASEWELFEEDYFRFKLRALNKSEQHNLLLELEDEIGEVFYSAPAFIKNRRMHDAFFTRSVVEETVFVRPSAIGHLPDEEEHSVSFLPNEDWGYFCSEPTKIKLSILGKNFVNELRETEFNSDKKWFGKFSEEYFYSLTKIMLQIYQKVTGSTVELEYYSDYRYPSYIRAGTIARNLFGCELLLAFKQNLGKQKT